MPPSPATPKRHKLPASTTPIAAQAQVVITGHIEPAAVAPGGKAKLVITATPNPELAHLCLRRQRPRPGRRQQADADPPRATARLDAIAGESLRPRQSPSPPRSGRARRASLTNEPVTWTIDLTAPADSPLGEVVLTGYLGFQTCDETAACRRTPSSSAPRFPSSSSREDGQIPLEFTRLSAARRQAERVSSYNDIADLAAANPTPDRRAQPPRPRCRCSASACSAA